MSGLSRREGKSLLKLLGSRLKFRWNWIVRALFAVRQRASRLGLEIEGIGSSPPGAEILGLQGGKLSP